VTPAPLLDVLAVGRSCIDLYAHEIGVPITAVKSFDAYVGGCPTNVSVGTSRLGLRTGLLTAVGEDQVGDFVLHFLREAGVDVSWVPRKPGRRTSAVIASLQSADGFELTFYRDNCADEALTTADVERAPVERSRVVFLTGTGLGREPGRTATLHAARRARAAGARVVTDIDLRRDAWDSLDTFGDEIRGLLRLSHLGVGTEAETCAAAGFADANAAAEALMREGLGAFVLKRGARGSTILRSGAEWTQVAPFPVEPISAVGAGDAFAAGLLYGLVNGWPLERAARLGNATGAIIVTRHGCANFMPTLPEVEAFVASQGGWDGLHGPTEVEA
jgi:5-dehydro-2-deoxygluconokinase